MEIKVNNKIKSLMWYLKPPLMEVNELIGIDDKSVQNLERNGKLEEKYHFYSARDPY